MASTRSTRPFAVAGLLALAFSFDASAGVVRYVDDDAAPGGDGLTPATAFQTINDALQANVIDGEILVAAGTYHERLEPNGNPSLICGVDGPGVTTIDGDGLGTVVEINFGPLTLRGFTITGGDGVATGTPGGGLWLRGADHRIEDCIFIGNTAGAGGAIYTETNFLSTNSIVDCVFIDNDSGLGTTSGGAVLHLRHALLMSGCVFIGNTSTHAGGLHVAGTGHATVVNTVFSRNMGNAAIQVTGGLTLINSSLSQNEGVALLLSNNAGPVTVTNCVFRDNEVASVLDDQSQPGGTATVTFSNVEGGWAGPGNDNIDADPLFVQPGNDDLRLGIGSPSIDAGDAGALPPDVLDVDDDGDVIEPWPLDLGGGARITGATVDHGAYEGAFAELPPATSDLNLDQGEVTFLAPGGVTPNPLASPVVLISNVGGPDHATVLVTSLDATPHPGACGYEVLGGVLSVETSLAIGDLVQTVFVTMTEADLDGLDPFSVDPIAYDAAADTWVLASSGNSQNSPGHPGPVGDRIEVTGPAPFGINAELGDHGIYWDPTSGAGIAWANLDHAGDVAFGVPLCSSDANCDGAVDIDDIVAVVLDFGTDGSANNGDVNGDGTTDIDDIMLVVLEFGGCR